MRIWRTAAIASGATIAVAGAVVWIAFATGLVERFYVYREGSDAVELDRSARVRIVSWSHPREIRPVEEERVAPSGSEPPGDPLLAARPGAPSDWVFFSAPGPGGDADLFVEEWTRAGWSRPVRLPEPVNSPADDEAPSLDSTGRLLLFASRRPGGLGGLDLYAARREGAGWSAPRSLGPRVNSPFDDTAPTLLAEARALVFATTRPRSLLESPPEDWSRILLERRQPGPSALAFARPVDDGGDARPRWESPTPLLAEGFEDTDPAFSPEGETLYFASRRAGGRGGLDLWKAAVDVARDARGRLTGLVLGPPENLGVPLNTRFDERRPQPFLGGEALHFEAVDSTRGAVARLESREREVSAEMAFAAVPLAIFRENLTRIAALLASGLALGLLVWLGIRQRRRLQASLLLRCGAVALLLHAALFYAFYFWVVSRGIVALAEKRLPEEVSIEEVLAAKITLDTNRIQVEAPQKEAPRPSAEPLRSVADALPAEQVLPEEARLLAPSEAPSLSTEITEPHLALAPPELQRPEPSMPLPVAEARPIALALPAPSPGAEAPPEVPAPLVASSAALTETAPPTPIEAAAPVDERAGSLADVAKGASSVPEASTPVEAPVDTRELPVPALRPREPTPAALASLPVPAQAPPGEEPRDPLAAARPEASASEPRALAAAPREARLETVTVEVADTPWQPRATGLVPLASPDAAAELELPAAPLPTVAPATQPAPLRERLPEPVALAEAPREGPSGEVLPLAPLAAEAPARALSPSSSGAPELLASATASAASPRLVSAVGADPPQLAARGQLLTEAQRGSWLPRGLPRGAASTPALALELPEEPAKGAPPAAGEEPLEPATPRAPGIRQEQQRARPPESVALAAPALLEGTPVPAAAEGLSSTSRPEPASLVGAPLGASAPGGPAPSAFVAERPARPRPSSAPLAIARLEEAPPEPSPPELAEVRSGPLRESLLEAGGGTEASEGAVRLALDWLARHQAPDGSWDVDGFDARCRRCGTPGTEPDCDLAVTALALLAFLGQNHTPTNGASPFRATSQAALRRILADQDGRGIFGANDRKYTMYGHAMATLAVSEAYLMTRDESLRPPLERAAAAIAAAQNQETGGWRYLPRPVDRGDTSVTGWQVLCLKSIRGAGIEVPEAVFDRARHWFDEEVAGGQSGGVFGYTSADEPRVAMVAEGMYARLLLGAQRTERRVDEAARYIYRQTIETRGSAYLDNLYLLYYGNLSLYHYQGWIWDRWNGEVRQYLVETQQTSGEARGSWSPTDPWCASGGRVLSTSLAALTLEVYYRYLPLYWALDSKPGSK